MCGVLVVAVLLESPGSWIVGVWSSWCGCPFGESEVMDGGCVEFMLEKPSTASYDHSV